MRLKALFIIQQSISPKVKVSDFDKIFRNHKVKHEYIHEFMRALMVHFYDTVDEYAKYVTTRKTRRIFERKNPEIATRIDWIKKNQKFSSEMYQLIEWLEKANSQKNMGFYVDIKDGDWKLPNQTSEDLYKNSIYNAQEIHKYVKFAESVLTKTQFNPSSEKNDSNKFK